MSLEDLRLLGVGKGLQESADMRCVYAHVCVKRKREERAMRSLAVYYEWTFILKDLTKVF